MSTSLLIFHKCWCLIIHGLSMRIYIGHVRNETLSVTMYQLSYKVELVERPSAIRPGFPLNITLKVTTHDDVPVGDSSPDALKVEHGFDYSAEGGVLRTSVPPNGIVVLEFVAPTNPKVCYEAIDVVSIVQFFLSGQPK